MAEERDKRFPWFGFVIYLFAAALVFFASFSNRVPPPKQLAYSDFLTQVLNGKVDTVRVTNSQLVGMLRPSGESGSKESISTLRLPSMDESWLMQELRNKQIQIIAEPQTNTFWNSLLAWLFPILMLVFFYFWAARARTGQSGFGSVGKSRAKIYDQYTQKAM
jgi:ATP-dependent Zn protease